MAASEQGATSFLGQGWLERWSKSDARRPIGSSDDAIFERIISHPQFR
jgi:hypothetical protein